MTREDIIHMAREAGLIYWTHNRWWMDAGEPGDELERFAALIASRVSAAAVEREAEAYAIPMTPDGVKSSQHRWRGFNEGYKQAIKDCVALLMIQHEAAKGAHNYWQVAANLIQADVSSNT